MLKIQGRDDCIFAMSQINVILRNLKLSHLSFYLKIQIVLECLFGVVQSIIFCLIADGLLQVTSCSSSVCSPGCVYMWISDSVYSEPLAF